MVEKHAGIDQVEFVGTRLTHADAEVKEVETLMLMRRCGAVRDHCNDLPTVPFPQDMMANRSEILRWSVEFWN